MLLLITSMIFLIPHRVIVLIQSRIRNSNILEVLIVAPFIFALMLESIKFQNYDLLLFIGLVFSYLIIYILYRKKIINNLGYSFKLYNIEGLENFQQTNSKIFYCSKFFIIILFFQYIVFNNIILSGFLSFFLLLIIAIFLKQRKNKQKVLQTNYDNTAINVLKKYNPSVVFYFTGTSTKFLYHIIMWLPYLKQTNLNFYILVREKKYLKILLQLVKDIPIVVATRLSDVEFFLPSSVKLAFYANNGTKNTHLIRFNDIIHIQLLHGESEKPPSYNPMSKIYDKLFVSGQRAIDRYSENNVFINKENFVIVGRPQVSKINVVRKNINKENYTILLAPTWQGFHLDSQFSSLLKMYDFILILLSRKENIKIILRLHPLTDIEDSTTKEVLENIKIKLSNDSREHIYCSNRDISEDFNESDCLVTDISSVPIDYIYSDKPIIHIDVNNLSYALETDIKYREYKKAIYLIDNKLNNTNYLFDDIFYKDTLYNIRLTVKEYYHGKLNQSSEKVFLEEIYKLISSSK